MATWYDSSVMAVERCEDFLAVRMAKPAGYTFSAGQWLRVSIDAPDGPQVRTLSHAAAPADEFLDIGTRLSDSAFKRSLALLEPGSALRVSPPGGRVTLDDIADTVFLAGGVGITPVRSLVRDAISREVDLTGAVLFFGNRDQSCIPYGAEIAQWMAAGLSVVHVLETVPEGSREEHGFITAQVVRRHAETAGKTFFVAGPPVMVSVMERLLDELGVEASLRHIEAFGKAEPVTAQTP